MKDLRKMDIEDIEKHKYNLRLFFAFLKKEGIYLKFKKLMFTNFNRTPHDLFQTMNETPMDMIFEKINGTCDEIDKKWSAIFSYAPFCRFPWTHENIGSFENMVEIIHKWCKYLIENKYNKTEK